MWLRWLKPWQWRQRIFNLILNQQTIIRLSMNNDPHSINCKIDQLSTNQKSGQSEKEPQFFNSFFFSFSAESNSISQQCTWNKYPISILAIDRTVPLNTGSDLVEKDFDWSTNEHRAESNKSLLARRFTNNGHFWMIEICGFRGWQWNDNHITLLPTNQKW